MALNAANSELRILVQLGSELTGFVDAKSSSGAACREALLEYVRELAIDLGVPADPSLSVEPLPEPEGTRLYAVRIDGRPCSLEPPLELPADVTPERLAAELARAVALNRQLCITPVIAGQLLPAWESSNPAVAACSPDAEAFRAMLQELVHRCFPVRPHSAERQVAVDQTRVRANASLLPELILEGIEATEVSLQVLVGPGPAAALAPDGGPPARPHSVAASLAGMTDALKVWIFDELGLVLPEVRHQLDPALADGQLRLVVNELRFPPLQGLRADETMLNAGRDELATLGVDARLGFHPTSGAEASVVRVDDAKLKELSAQYSTWGSETYVLFRTVREIRRHAGALLAPDAVAFHLSRARDAYPVTVDAALARFDQAQLTAVLRRLLDEQISIRDLGGILEGMLAVNGDLSIDQSRYRVITPHAASLWPVLNGVELEVPGVDELVDCVRRHLRGQVTSMYAAGVQRLMTLPLDRRLEARLGESAIRPLAESEREEVRGLVWAAYEPLARSDKRCVIITNSQVRRAMRRLLEKEYPFLPVLSWQEVAPGTNLEPVARIGGDGKEVEMPVSISETRDRVASMLARVVGPVQLDPDGDLSFAYESTRVYVSVKPFGPNSSVVNIFAVTNVDVPPSPELYKFVATNSWIFGTLSVQQAEGRTAVVFSHTLLADYLDQDELTTALAAVASTADDLDDQIKEKFGGRLPTDPPVAERPV